MRSEEGIRAVAMLNLCLVFLGGCVMGEDYQRPEVDIPESWAVVAGEKAEMVPVETDRLPEAEWWRAFQNEELTRLVERALEQNHDVRAAAARVFEGRAAVVAAGAGLYPQLNVVSSYSRIRRSETILVGPTSGAPQGFAGPGAEFDIWNALLDLHWEVDLWGRIRRGREAAEADTRALDDDLRAVQLALIGDVGEAYFRIRELDEQLEITAQNLTIQQEALSIIVSKSQAGLSSDLDVRRGEAIVAETASRLPDLRRLRAAELHRISVLVGANPGTLRLEPRPLRSVVTQPAIPAGLPAQLLERRPDIRRVEHQLEAANARIGEARAQFFPSLSITGQGGIQSSDFAEWFTSSSRATTIGPSVTLPIFLGGTNVARLDTARARYEQMLEDYRQTILESFQEVADLLVAIRARTEQLDRQREEVQASEAAERLAIVRYRQGLVDFLEVIDAQRTVLDAESRFVETERARLVDMVKLFKALGGGWDDRGAESNRRERMEKVRSEKRGTWNKKQVGG